MATTRETSIDVMRFLGLLSIFLAHAKTGDPFFQFRCFDVPMMLFISGLSYSGRQTGDYLKFVWKRATRLLVPLYIFLTCYFLLKWGLHEMGWADKMVKSAKIWGSYKLYLNPSIGKVWIFRVFLIVMLLTPPLIALEKRCKGVWFWIAFALLFAAQGALVEWVHPLKAGRFVEDWCLYAIGYSIPFFLGAHMRYASTRNNVLTFAGLGIVFTLAAIFLVDGPWLYFQKIKYPPHLYYILWGCLISAILWTSRKLWVRFLDCRFTRWVGMSTIWIYLWHTPFVCDVTKVYMKNCHWSLRFAVLSVAGVGLYAIQYAIVSKLEKTHPDARFLKYFKG